MNAFWRAFGIISVGLFSGILSFVVVTRLAASIVGRRALRLMEIGDAIKLKGQNIMADQAMVKTEVAELHAKVLALGEARTRVAEAVKAAVDTGNAAAVPALRAELERIASQNAEIENQLRVIERSHNAIGQRVDAFQQEADHVRRSLRRLNRIAGLLSLFANVEPEKGE